MVEQNPSWSEAIVEGSLDWSFLAFDDLGEVADLCAAIEYFDNPAQHRGIAELEADYALRQAHAGQHAVVGRDAGGTIVAYAWNHITASDDRLPHVWMEIGVHPAWRHHKIGLRLVGWSIERARTWYRHIRETRDTVGPLWVGCATDEGSRVASDLRSDGQLVPQRWFFDAHRPLLDQELPEPSVPDGFRLVTFESQLSEQVRVAHNAAFSTRRGAHDVSEADWAASVTRPEFRPNWSWLAIHHALDVPEVVGYALNSEINDELTGWGEGWTERLGVRPPHRGKGLGQALLIASMHSFADAGCELAGIGVDTDDPDRSVRLFQSLGYEFDDRVVLFGATFVS